MTPCPDCRIELRKERINGKLTTLAGQRIIFCPLHQSAGRMREALRELYENALRELRMTSEEVSGTNNMMAKAKAALAASEGKEPG